MRHTILRFPICASIVLAGLGFLTNALKGQGNASLQFTQSFTTATTGAAVSNGPTVNGGPQGSVGFRLIYYIQPGSGTVSALSIQLNGASTATGSYTALSPASGGGSGSGATTNPATTSPRGQINLCCDFWPFLRVQVNTLTVASGTPVLIVKVLGYAGTSAAVGSGGGGGGGGTIAKTTNALTGDGSGNAIAATGTGTNCLLVDGGNVTCSSAASAFTLLEEHTASTSTELDFTTCISATYDDYQIETVGLLPSTTANIGIQFSTNGGSSYDTGANYSWLAQFGYAPGVVSTNNANGDTALNYRSTPGAIISGFSYVATYKLYAPGSTVLNKQMAATIWVADNSLGILAINWAGYYGNTAAVNAFRFIPSTGNFTSGSIRCYGISH